MENPEYQSRRPLVGIDGNAFSIIATVSRGLREAGAPPEFVSQFNAECMSSESYDKLLQVAMRYTASDAIGGEEG